MRKTTLFWIAIIVILLAGIGVVIFSQLALNKEEKKIAIPFVQELPDIPKKIDTSNLKAPPDLDVESLKAPTAPDMLQPPPLPPLP